MTGEAAKLFFIFPAQGMIFLMQLSYYRRPRAAFLWADQRETLWWRIREYGLVQRSPPLMATGSFGPILAGGRVSVMAFLVCRQAILSTWYEITPDAAPRAWNSRSVAGGTFTSI